MENKCDEGKNKGETEKNNEEKVGNGVKVRRRNRLRYWERDKGSKLGKKLKGRRLRHEPGEKTKESTRNGLKKKLGRGSEKDCVTNWRRD